MGEIGYSNFPFNITPGTNIQQSIGFNPRFAIVSNYSPYYIYFPDALSYCPPWTAGAVLALAHATYARATWDQSPFGSQPLTISGIFSASITFTDDPRLSTVGGSPITDPTLQGAASWYPALSAAGRYFASTWRTLGNATVDQHLLSIVNNDPTLLVGIRRIIITMDATAALAVVAPYFRFSNYGYVSGGTVLTKFSQAPLITPTSSASVIVRGATASDGGAATPIVPLVTNDPMLERFANRMHTVVGERLAANEIELLSPFDPPIVIKFGVAGFGLKVVAAAATSNPATNHYLTQIEWDESPNPSNL